MAITCYNDYFNHGAAPTTASNATAISAGTWFDNTGTSLERWAQWGVSSYASSVRNLPNSTNTNGSWESALTGLTADQDYGYLRHYVDNGTAFYSSNSAFRAAAQVAVMPAPGSSSVTSTTATITTNSYTANVVSSTYVVTLYYKKTSDPSYTSAGTTTSVNPFTANLTGLTASTQYQFYAEIVRTTQNLTTLASSVGNFTTAAGVPTVVTDAATSISNNSANANDTVTINSGTTVTTYWKYGIQNPPTDSTTASQSVSGSGAYSVGLTSLTASTLYYVQSFVAFDTPAGTPSSGNVISFTTSVDPAAEAAAEDHLTIQEYDAVYGVQKAFVFLAASPAATSSNIFLSAAAPWATTECRITIDGGAVADCTNAPSRIGTSAFYTITLTAGELSGENIWVHIADSAVAARDVALHIRTSLEVGKVVANAAAMATGTSAFLCTGIGAGHGASFVGGATGNDINGVLGNHVIRKAIAQAGGASTITLDASASATNNFYNGALVVVISGTGTAQSRFIISYDGGTKVATVHRAWSTNPAVSAVFIIVPAEDVWVQAATAELSSIPTATSSWADKIQFLWQRFAYKRTETATVFTMTKADSSTSLGTAAVSDNGTTQSHAKIA